MARGIIRGGGVNQGCTVKPIARGRRESIYSIKSHSVWILQRLNQIRFKYRLNLIAIWFDFPVRVRPPVLVYTPSYEILDKTLFHHLHGEYLEIYGMPISHGASYNDRKSRVRYAYRPTRPICI